MSQQYTLKALSPEIGVEVVDCDLSRRLDAAAIKEIREIIDTHSIVLFRNQDITPEGQIELIASLCPVFDELEDGNDLYFFDQAIGKGAPAIGRSERSHAHADFMWTSSPIPLISLYGIDIDDNSGPTRFYNCTRAATQLTDEERAKYSGLRAVHARTDIDVEYAHPVLMTNRRTGVPVLYMSELFTQRIEGLSKEESDAVLSEIYAKLRQPENILDHVWKPKDLLIWDNLATVHERIESKILTAPRVLRRVSGSEKTFAEMLPDDGGRERYCTSLLHEVRRGGPLTSVVGGEHG